MKIILAILALFVALSYADGECAVFACSSIDQEGDTRLCGQRTDGTEGAANTFAAQECTGDDFCQADAWTDPTTAAGAAANLQCGANNPSNFPQDFTATAGVGLDGDYCTADGDCFTSGENEAKCTNSVCVASTKADSSCAGKSENCPVGHFCSAEDKCAPLLTANSVCTKDSDCAIGHDCIKLSPDGTEFKCTEFGTLNNGDRFTRATNTAPSGSLGAATVVASTVCKTTGEATVEETQQCRNHQRNKDDSLRSPNLQTQCKTATFVDEAADNFNTETEVLVNPICGFNKDNKAICPVFLGDKPVQDLLAENSKFTKGLKCHRLSGVTSFGTGSVCKGFWDVRDKKEGFNLFRLGQILDPQTWANTANNNDCVANTITFKNWNGFNSAYLSYGAVGMITTALAYIMM